MRLADLDYPLPRELIAQRPAARREQARLLVLPRGGPIEHSGIERLPAVLERRFPRGALIVLNDTRVRPARLRGSKVPTGGTIELLLLSREPAADTRGLEAWRCLAGSSKPLRAGTEIALQGERPPRALALTDASQGQAVVAFGPYEPGEPVARALERAGEIPLPPYIQREQPVRVGSVDAERYQTIYAREEGAVAAPTAGLHFTRALLDELARAGFPQAHVTLHVGLGTFEPLRVEEGDDVRQHRLHAERYEIPAETLAAIERARGEGRAILAVGTTTTRALESYALTGHAAGETELYITPGHAFRLVDALLTNFHLPRSTLLLLVFALAGRERLLQAYAEAVRERYRFYSFGDAMLIL